MAYFLNQQWRISLQSSKRYNFEQIILTRLEVIEKGIEKLSKVLESNYSGDHEVSSTSNPGMLEKILVSSIERNLGLGIQEKILSIDDRTKKIFENLSGYQDKEKQRSADEERMVQDDRKRLKERLKDAVHSQDSTASTNKNMTWIEYIFGICKADGRIGKDRSRSREPCINFAAESSEISVLLSAGLFILSHASCKVFLATILLNFFA